MKNADKTRSHQMPLVRVNIFDRVKSNRKLNIRRIKIDHVVNPLFRNVIKELFGGIAVRIHKTNAFAGLYVLDGHIFQNRGLAHAGLSDDVHVFAPVLALYSESGSLVAKICLREICDIVHSVFIMSADRLAARLSWLLSGEPSGRSLWK